MVSCAGGVSRRMMVSDRTGLVMSMTRSIRAWRLAAATVPTPWPVPRPVEGRPSAAAGGSGVPPGVGRPSVMRGNERHFDHRSGMVRGSIRKRGYGHKQAAATAQHTHAPLGRNYCGLLSIGKWALGYSRHCGRQLSIPVLGFPKLDKIRTRLERLGLRLDRSRLSLAL